MELELASFLFPPLAVVGVSVAVIETRGNTKEEALGALAVVFTQPI